MPKGNLNFTFNLKTLGGTPTLKKKTIAKLAQTKLETCIIFGKPKIVKKASLLESIIHRNSFKDG